MLKKSEQLSSRRSGFFKGTSLPTGETSQMAHGSNRARRTNYVKLHHARDAAPFLRDTSKHTLYKPFAQAAATFCDLAERRTFRTRRRYANFPGATDVQHHTHVMPTLRKCAVASTQIPNSAVPVRSNVGTRNIFF